MDTHSDTNKILVVDLDDTLLKSDMLFETFWNSVSTKWTNVFKAVSAALGGKARLKRWLVDHSFVDVSTLPYNQDVLQYIKDWRAKGGQTALVSASDEKVTKEIAEHLGLFDETHGSNGEANLKGITKANFLRERFGENGFAYVGDSHADLSVWREASDIITINASTSLKRKVEEIGTALHIGTAKVDTKSYIKALRLHQWLKNCLVFIPILASQSFSLQDVVSAIAAFVAFSLMASSVYITNDLLDLKADRSHPRKRSRPFASGSIPLSHGTLLSIGLLCAGFLVSLQLGTTFLAVMVLYLTVTFAYSLDLKRRVIIDICVLAGLYTLRIIAGGAATQIPLSVWLLAFSIFFFFSLAAIKRQAELVDLKNRSELAATGRGYHVDDLNLMSQISISSGFVSVLVMALYVNSPAILVLYKSPIALWGICPILLFWITKMVMVTQRGQMHDDPLVFAVTDRASQVCFGLVLLIVVGGAII